MPKIKKNEKSFLNVLKELLFSLEKVSKRLLYFGCVAISLTYLGAMFVTAAADLIFPDVTTALFWGGELLNLGKELMGAVFVPVLLFELLLIISGRKKSDN